jgi:hypothetical protein
LFPYFLCKPYYLKGYTSWLYTGSSWDAPDVEKGYLVNMPSSQGPSSSSLIASDRILSESHALDLMADAGMIGRSSARMTIENVDADTGYLYIPYCISSIPDASIPQSGSYLTGFSAADAGRTYDFVPYTLSERENIMTAGSSLTGLYDEKGSMP